MIKLDSYIVKDCKCFSDILLLKIRIYLESKVRSNEPFCPSQNLRCHHKEKIWKLDDARCIFINHVYEILQLFFSGILSNSSVKIHIILLIVKPGPQTLRPQIPQTLPHPSSNKFKNPVSLKGTGADTKILGLP